MAEMSTLNNYEIVDKTARNKINDLTIGYGDNLFTGRYQTIYTENNPCVLTTTNKDGNTVEQSIYTRCELKGGKSYIVSAKTDGTWALMHTNEGQDRKYVSLWLCLNYFMEDSYRSYYVLLNPINNTWIWKCPEECDGMYATVRLNNYNTDGTTSVTHKFWDFSMKEGNAITDAICNRQSAIMFGNTGPDNNVGNDRDFYVML